MSESINVNFKKLSDKAVIPTKAHLTDAGFDIVATSVNETDDYIEYGTSIAVEIPENHVGLLFPRSSVSKYDLQQSNSVGVIDSCFRGEVKFRFNKVLNPAKVKISKQYKFINFFQRLFGFEDTISDVTLSYDLNIYNVGDKIGQLIIIPYPQVTFTEVQTLTESDRGENGFGSTDQPTPSKKPRRTKKKVSK